MQTVSMDYYLQNANIIFQMAQQSGQPIFVTNNGNSELVVMSPVTYQKRCGSKSVIDERLARADKELAEGAPRIDGETFFIHMEKKYGF